MTRTTNSHHAEQNHHDPMNADIDAALADIRHMITTPSLVTNAEELAALERDITQ